MRILFVYCCRLPRVRCDSVATPRCWVEVTQSKSYEVIPVSTTSPMSVYSFDPSAFYSGSLSVACDKTTRAKWRQSGVQSGAKPVMMCVTQAGAHVCSILCYA